MKKSVLLAELGIVIYVFASQSANAIAKLEKKLPMIIIRIGERG